MQQQSVLKEARQCTGAREQPGLAETDPGVPGSEPRRALAGVAQSGEHQPANQRVTGLVPSQGTCLGCRPGPQWVVCERQPHIDVSLFLSLPLSKNK